MSYRSIKRVLGENSLERKCRILFGFCMFFLIGGSFWGVMRLSEDFIREDTRNKAAKLVYLYMLKTHMATLQLQETNPDKLLVSIAREITDLDIEIDSVVLDQTLMRREAYAHLPEDEEERQIVEALVAKYASFQSDEHFDIYREGDGATGSRVSEAHESGSSSAEELEGELDGEQSTLGSFGMQDEFMDRFASDNRYLYYKPVVFKRGLCYACHAPARPRYADDVDPNELSPSEAADAVLDWEIAASEKDEESGRLIPPLPPMYVLRLTMGYEEANEGFARNRAILLAAAIVTAFLSTAALYVIIRYVIVKPLQHLQGVIKQVSAGDMDVRSDVNTGDEFEELSKSLNRMLRHLADSQSALKDANQGLDQKIEEQAQLTMKLFEMNQIKSDFLTNMSHELRTPLNSIIGFSEILAEIDSLNQKQQGWARNIQNSGHALLELINGILDLAKLEAGKVEVNPQEFRVATLVDELCEMIRPVAGKKSILVSGHTDPSLPVVWLDHGKVRQIITNLLGNAVKFTPEGGRVRVEATRRADKLLIRVSDTGIGIPEAERAMIFDKFRQAPSTLGDDSLTRRHAGTGLGLSIVRELCAIQGGSVSVESEVGKGSTFLVTLPLRFVAVAEIRSEIAEQVDNLMHAQRIHMTKPHANGEASGEREQESPEHTRDNDETESETESEKE